ncbi:putative surface protein with fasciclin (FAS1) repeats [Spirosoma lacussanchae]|uniref:fasciclin domain-containing protein n=1 Tax=Spirosoma lacussanchae TaxID=1884249 RepID=UPI0011094298|nr:fasciclin domain-containing protein [Spirosoma lacussanchae]
MTKKTYLGWALALSLFVGSTALVSAQTQNAVGRADSSGTMTTTSTTAEGTLKAGGSTGRDLTISAAKSADHTVLFRALRISGLTEQASGKGPYTVFAPTNEAFSKLPEGALDALLKPAGKQKLVKLLAYHVVKGKFSAEQLQDGQKLKTVTGGTLTVSKQGDAITITDGQGSVATINQADIEATNGMIHSVDTVLMPTGAK